MKLSDKVYDKGIQKMIGDLEQELYQVRLEAMHSASLVETTATYGLFLCKLIADEGKDVIVFLDAVLGTLEANAFHEKRTLASDLEATDMDIKVGGGELTEPFF